MTSADFVAARARIGARRAHRQASAASSQAQLPPSTLTNLPTPLRQILTTASSTFTTLTSRYGTQPSFRVGQVDAELLDEELLNLFQGQVSEALKYYSTSLRNDWHAEIELALRAVLYKLTVWDHGASYGASLQGLRFSDARGEGARGRGVPQEARRWQKGVYGLISVGGRYCWGKWNDHLLDVEGGYDEPSSLMKLAAYLTTTATTTHSLASFASFLVFLLDGRYRTILDRVLRLRLTPTSNHVSREVSFEYLNRQLVWHAFTEFLLFLLPLVGISRWRRWIGRAWIRTMAMFLPNVSTGDEEQSGGELGFLPERTCAICYQDQNPANASDGDVATISATSSGVVGSASTDVTNPYEVTCGCVYCFVCVAQRLEAEDGEDWVCLRCGELVKECRAWGGDVVGEGSGARAWGKEGSRADSGGKGSGKRVSFLDEGFVEKEEEAEERSEAEGERSFQTLDPMPIDDEKAALLQADDADESEHALTSSLGESTEWSRVGLDATPTNGHEGSLGKGEASMTEEGEASMLDEKTGNTEEDHFTVASEAIDFSDFDANGALVDDDEAEEDAT